MIGKIICDIGILIVIFIFIVNIKGGDYGLWKSVFSVIAILCLIIGFVFVSNLFLSIAIYAVVAYLFVFLCGTELDYWPFVLIGISKLVSTIFFLKSDSGYSKIDNYSLVSVIINATFVLIMFIIMVLNRKKTKEQNRTNHDLLDAVITGNKETVQRLIECGANIYHENGAILLESAIRNCDKEMITLLLDKGVDVNFVHCGKVPLDCTADEEIIALLKSRGAKTKSEIDAAKAEREREAREKREAVKKEEEERRAREEAARKERCKLIDACRHGHLNEAKRLIQSGFDLEVRNEEGQTALMIVVKSAVANGFSEIKDAVRENNDIAKLLIQSGAKIDAKDNKGLTALMHSAMMFFEHAPLLLENGAEVNARNNKGFTVLMYACINSFKNASIVEFLISKGANVNAKEDSNNETALMFATAAGNIEAVSALIRNGADVNAKARNGATALSAAISKGYTEIKNILINNGAYR